VCNIREYTKGRGYDKREIKFRDGIRRYCVTPKEDGRGGGIPRVFVDSSYQRGQSGVFSEDYSGKYYLI